MTWLKLYQSDTCWLFWFDCTTPCHRLTVPHGQIGGRPIANRMAAKAASSAAATSQPRLETPRIIAAPSRLTAPVSRAISAHGCKRPPEPPRRVVRPLLALGRGQDNHLRS